MDKDTKFLGINYSHVERIISHEVKIYSFSVRIYSHGVRINCFAEEKEFCSGIKYFSIGNARLFVG